MPSSIRPSFSPKPKYQVTLGDPGAVDNDVIDLRFKIQCRITQRTIELIYVEAFTSLPHVDPLNEKNKKIPTGGAESRFAGDGPAEQISNVIPLLFLF